MTQHINLLSKSTKAPADSAVKILLAPLAVVLLALLALWAMGQSKEAEAQRNEQAAQQQLQLTQSRLEAGLKSTTGNLDKEIAALRPRAEAAQVVVNQFGTLGRQQGYSDYLSALASTTVPGVWLSRIEITQNGKAVNLSGRALDRAAVLEYVKKLNAKMSGFDIEFKTLDINVERAQGAPGTDAALAVVNFKLS